MTDALTLSVAAHALAGIAEEMGAVLVRGALSPNIRERRDASCALFDARGRLAAQAAHIPVHLGAMPESVAAVLALDPAPGDVWLLNDPAAGGSHLPDLTMIEVIGFRGRVAGFAAVRAHHADVGGMAPGSMPFAARELVQEGVIVPPVRLVRGGAAQPDTLRFVLANVRTPAEREGDLAAQRAACAAGRDRWRAYLAAHGPAAAAATVDALLDYAERRARALLLAHEGAQGAASDALEGDGVHDGAVAIRVAVTVRDGTLHLDFDGTAPAVAGNLNAPRAVTRAAALFALRVLLDDDVPVNAGLERALSLAIPPRSLLDARRPSAVAAGNVETSQRVTDVIVAALGAAGFAVPAAGQGTMNNVAFGGPGWTFYETLGGGQGASARGPGPSAVHVGMSNTRNTPIEELERAYPLRVARYALRRGSGGAGAQRGGDGVVRAYRAMAPCTVTLLTERRTLAPPGAAGGAPGAPGINRLNGAVIAAKGLYDLRAGDVVTIETPGGGGFGAAP